MPAHIDTAPVDPLDEALALEYFIGGVENDKTTKIDERPEREEVIKGR